MRCADLDVLDAASLWPSFAVSTLARNHFDGHSVAPSHWPFYHSRVAEDSNPKSRDWVPGSIGAQSHRQLYTVMADYDDASADQKNVIRISSMRARGARIYCHTSQGSEEGYNSRVNP